MNYFNRTRLFLKKCLDPCPPGSFLCLFAEGIKWGGLFARRLKKASRFSSRHDLNGVAVRVYRGFGTHRQAYLFGRVFKEPFPAKEHERGSFKKNLLILLKLIMRRGVAHAVVQVRLGRSYRQVTCDRSGFFFTRLTLNLCADDAQLWHPAVVTVLKPNLNNGVATATAPVYVAPSAATVAVISDIDDTVVYTGVANKINMLRQLFFSNAESRSAFAGVDAFYQGLYHGASKKPQHNPMLYLSRAPWSIYDVLDAFFNMHHIPAGPILFLRYWGMTLDHPFPKRAKDHKLAAIKKMLQIYDPMPFILIGDSGQKDPEVYARMVKENPRRILAVYIRSISPDPSRRQSIHRLAQETKKAGCELVLAENSLTMARHAQKYGFIAEDTVLNVKTACRNDSLGC